MANPPVPKPDSMLDALSREETRRKLPKVPSELSLIMKMQNQSDSTNEPPRSSRTLNRCATIPEGRSAVNVTIPAIPLGKEVSCQTMTVDRDPGRPSTTATVTALKTLDSQLVGCTFSVPTAVADVGTGIGTGTGAHVKSGTHTQSPLPEHADNLVELSYTVDQHHPHVPIDARRITDFHSVSIFAVSKPLKRVSSKASVCSVDSNYPPPRKAMSSKKLPGNLVDLS